MNRVAIALSLLFAMPAFASHNVRCYSKDDGTSFHLEGPISPLGVFYTFKGNGFVEKYNTALPNKPGTPGFVINRWNGEEVDVTLPNQFRFRVVGNLRHASKVQFQVMMSGQWQLNRQVDCTYSISAD